MFEDEAGFGRINKPKRCWCPKGQRPSVPCHHIREYRYAFGAVEPLSGESFFLTMPNCDTECTNIFLEKLSEQYPDDIILLVCDGAAWHKSKALRCPENIQLLSIPPYTPEMNPIEQIWKQIRSMGLILVARILFQALLPIPTTHRRDTSLIQVQYLPDFFYFFSFISQHQYTQTAADVFVFRCRFLCLNRFVLSFCYLKTLHFSSPFPL